VSELQFITPRRVHTALPEPRPRLDHRLGAHVSVVDGRQGVRFRVVAPQAERVSVIGDFNGWDGSRTSMQRVTNVWECFVPNVSPGALYKYRIHGPNTASNVMDKADPLAFATECPPGTASRVWDLSRYQWDDANWIASRGQNTRLDRPVSIYEVHLGSWMRAPNGSWLTYRELAEQLAEHTCQLGFTHVELLPVAEHPFDGSWGYQALSYYAPTSRYGNPDDFMGFVDTLHQAGIGVILDWAPGHFPNDTHGLAGFDGTYLYEHTDPRQRSHPDWHTLVFDHGRQEVADFLVSSAMFWLDQYHVDGFRVDAVASMLYLDYSRPVGSWTPNRHGGNENLDAVAFLRLLNNSVQKQFPDSLMIAEESTAWPQVSHPVQAGGLGFDFKWNMGWMHDVLDFMSRPPEERPAHQAQLTESLGYAFAERFVLPLSHDEVVHGKGSLFNKMPGTRNEKFANLRLLFGWMFGYPGKKLLFMGNEFGQRGEWQHDSNLEWHRRDKLGWGLQRWVCDLNRLYRVEPALHGLDSDPSGFAWVDRGHEVPGLISFTRRGASPRDLVLCVYNFTDSLHVDHPFGVPCAGFWRERLNSNSVHYGGSNHGNFGGRQTVREPTRGFPAILPLVVPPLSMLMLAQDDVTEPYDVPDTDHDR